MNDLVTQEGRPLTANQIRARVNLIQEVMKAVMKQGTHYGIIPGCDKPTLYKAGSEQLLSTFQVAAEPVVEDLSTPDVARFRVVVKGIGIVNGSFLGSGVGECSSDEEKYKWKKAVCDDEWEETPTDRRREKWFKGRNGGSPYKVKQIRTNAADVANTVLKMGKKRGQIDMTLTTTAASDCFIQDIESEEDLENVGGVAEPASTPKQDLEKPKSKSAAPAAAPVEMSISDALKATTGTIISKVEGILANAKETSFKSGKIKTAYTITADGASITVDDWRKQIDGICPEMPVIATGIMVGEYNGAKQYTAKNVEVKTNEIPFGE